MFPNMMTIIIILLITVIIILIGQIFSNTFGSIIEILLLMRLSIYLFETRSFIEAFVLISLSATIYLNIKMIINKNKRDIGNELKHKLKKTKYDIVAQKKDYKRIMIDLMLTIIVSMGAVLFLFIAPETYGLLKFILVIGLIGILGESVIRIGNFTSTHIYFLPEEERLFIISPFNSRNLPMEDVKSVTKESKPDLLKLHSFFTFMSANQDYTTAFEPTLRLSFPGENIYMTPEKINEWQYVFEIYSETKQTNKYKKVLPMSHPQNLKRLFWKGYFALALKGISAYVILLFIFIWLDVNIYIMISIILFLWVFNMFVSDRVIIAGTDAVEIIEGDLYNRAKTIFAKAGISNTKLYLMDSPIFNGLTTGMNIGQSTIMITKATTQLPINSIEAIIAHEAAHVKNRDVIANQVVRISFFVLLGGVIFIFYSELKLLFGNIFLLIPLVYFVMILFSSYISFFTQRTEMRADYMGAKLLDGGSYQMAQGLIDLGNAQDNALKKVIKYKMGDAIEIKRKASIERGNWFSRLIEFQFQLHPPLYFRIYCLSLSLNWKKTWKKWLIGRILEPVPDSFKN